MALIDEETVFPDFIGRSPQNSPFKTPINSIFVAGNPYFPPQSYIHTHTVSVNMEIDGKNRHVGD